jgi:3-methylcrotonyl-CoA carboxylase beta subunit
LDWVEGAARLWIDKIVDPLETRSALIAALEAAALNPQVRESEIYVLQT